MVELESNREFDGLHDSTLVAPFVWVNAIGTSNQPLQGRRSHAYFAAVNWHEVIDERNYEMDQVIADILRRDPAKLDLAVAWMEKWLADPDYSVHSKDALTEWLDLIKTRGLPGVLEMLAERSENATRMRQSSPFAVIMPQDERMRILRKYEAFRTRTHPAGV